MYILRKKTCLFGIFSLRTIQKTYSYPYYPAGTHRTAIEEGLITENQLANDILYVALHWGK